MPRKLFDLKGGPNYIYVIAYSVINDKKKVASDIKGRTPYLPRPLYLDGPNFHPVHNVERK